MESWREMPVRYICKPEGTSSTRRFETLCLFHFFDIFVFRKEFDLIVARDFTKRWGPLQENQALSDYEKANFWEHRHLCLKLDNALALYRIQKEVHLHGSIPEREVRKLESEELPVPTHLKARAILASMGRGEPKPRLDVSGFNIVMDEYDGIIRPHLEAKDLASALTVTALLRGRDDYTECYFLTHINKTKSKRRRKHKCNRWVLTTGRPGRTTRHWCSDSCREAVKYDEKIEKKGAKK